MVNLVRVKWKPPSDRAKAAGIEFAAFDLPDSSPEFELGIYGHNLLDEEIYFPKGEARRGWMIDG